MPFGEEFFADGTYRTTSAKYSTTGFDAVRQRFTGYQRDAETSLDFAEARYYQNAHGRFTAVDPLLASGKSADPQTFNRYVYVMNNPLILVDPTGLQAGKRVYVGTVDGKTHYSLRSSRPNGYDPVRSERRVNADDGFIYRVTSRSIVGVGKWNRSVATPSQGIDTSVTPAGQDNTRALINELGARSEGSMQMIGALVGAATVGGLAAVPAATVGGFILAGTVVGEALLAEQGIRHNAEAAHEAAVAGSIESDRRAAVRDAWRLEAENVRNGGEGTHPWTAEQRKELIETGKVKGFDGHHINSVHDNPGMARDPRNIKFTDAHLEEHGGNWRNPTKGRLIPR